MVNTKFLVLNPENHYKPLKITDSSLVDILVKDKKTKKNEI